MVSNNKMRRKRFLRIGFICLAPIALYCLLLGAYYWSNAGRSQDRVGVLMAMIELRFSRQKIVSVRGRPDMLLAKAEYGEKFELNHHMNNLGWEYSDQMGSVSYFHDGNKKREVSHLSMTRHFMLYTLKSPHS